MPRYDGTGPQGLGPNGRRMGPCGSGISATRRGVFGFGRMWRGIGRGFWWSRQPAVDEKTALRNEKEWLNRQIDDIDQRLNEMEE